MAAVKRSLKKPATKKLATKKPEARRLGAKKVARKTAAGKPIVRIPAGYVTAPGAKILVPAGAVVEPSKLRKGLAKAKDEIDGLIHEIVDLSTTDYEIVEIEFAASFSADGKFLGVGVGGSATVTFRIRPCS